MNDQQEPNKIAERLTRCFAAVFPGLSRGQIASASVETVEAWDSVAGVTLVSAIEEEFGTELDPDMLESLVSFRAILEYLSEQPAGRSAKSEN
jgi:acyl carrier protein